MPKTCLAGLCHFVLIAALRHAESEPRFRGKWREEEAGDWYCGVPLHFRRRGRGYLGDRDCYPHFKIKKLTSEVKQFIREHQGSGTTGNFFVP